MYNSTTTGGCWSVTLIGPKGLNAPLHPSCVVVSEMILNLPVGKPVGPLGLFNGSRHVAAAATLYSELLSDLK